MMSPFTVTIQAIGLRIGAPILIHHSSAAGAREPALAAALVSSAGAAVQEPSAAVCDGATQAPGR